MAKEEQKKPWYKNIGLIIVIGIIIWVAYQYYSYEVENEYSPEKSVKENLEEYNYEVLDVYKIDIIDDGPAVVKMKALGSRKEQVLKGIERLSYAYSNTSTYIVYILTDSQTCTYTSSKLYKDSYGLKHELQISEDGVISGWYYNKLVDYINEQNKDDKFYRPFEFKENGSLINSTDLYILERYQIMAFERCS